MYQWNGTNQHNFWFICNLNVEVLFKNKDTDSKATDFWHFFRNTYSDISKTFARIN